MFLSNIEFAAKGKIAVFLNGTTKAADLIQPMREIRDSLFTYRRDIYELLALWEEYERTGDPVVRINLANPKRREGCVPAFGKALAIASKSRRSRRYSSCSSLNGFHLYTVFYAIA